MPNNRPSNETAPRKPRLRSLGTRFPVISAGLTRVVALVTVLGVGCVGSDSEDSRSSFGQTSVEKASNGSSPEPGEIKTEEPAKSAENEAKSNEMQSESAETVASTVTSPTEKAMSELKSALNLLKDKKNLTRSDLKPFSTALEAVLEIENNADNPEIQQEIAETLEAMVKDIENPLLADAMTKTTFKNWSKDDKNDSKFDLWLKMLSESSPKKALDAGGKLWPEKYISDSRGLRSNNAETIVNALYQLQSFPIVFSDNQKDERLWRAAVDYSLISQGPKQNVEGGDTHRDVIAVARAICRWIDKRGEESDNEVEFQVKKRAFRRKLVAREKGVDGKGGLLKLIYDGDENEKVQHQLAAMAGLRFIIDYININAKIRKLQGLKKDGPIVIEDDSEPIITEVQAKKLQKLDPIQRVIAVQAIEKEKTRTADQAIKIYHLNEVIMPDGTLAMPERALEEISRNTKLDHERLILARFNRTSH